MTQQKKMSDVRGYSSKCVNFEQCTLCYGCRNYRHNVSDCEACAKDVKTNICNTKKHRSELISKMVVRPRIEINNLNFKGE